LSDYLAFQAKPIPIVKKPLTTADNKIVKKPETVPTIKESTTKATAKVETEKKPLEKLTENKKIEKPIVTAPTKVAEKPVEKLVQTEKAVEKPVEKPVQTSVGQIKKDTVVKPEKKTIPVVVEPKKEELPLFKGLFAYKADDAHFIAIYVISGTIDFAKTKSAIDAYNTQNYSVMNLKVSLETIDKVQVIIIGSLTNAQLAKSYLLRLVKEKGIFDSLKGANYRNLLGSQKNLNVLMQQNALNQYFDFIQEYYLK